MPRILKIGLLGLAGLFALVLTAVLGVFFWLHTDSGARFLLGKLQSFAAENYGVQIGYSKISFSPFQHIHLENLKVTRGEGAERLELTLDELDARYAIHWLSRSVVIESVLVRKPAALFRTAGKPGASAPAPETKPASGGPLVLPINVTLKKLEVQDASWDVAMGDDTQSVGGGSMDFAFLANRSGTIEVQPSHFRFTAKRIQAAGTQVDDAELTAEAKLLFESGVVKTVEASGGAKIPFVKTKDARVGGTSLTFQAAKQEKVRLDLKLESAEVAAGPFAAHPQRLLASAAAVVAADLSSGDVEGTAELGGKEFLKYQAKATANSVVHVEGTAKARLGNPISGILSPAAAKYGEISADLKFAGTLESPARSLADVDAERIKSSAATSDIHLDLVQEKSEPGGPRLKPVTLDGKMRIEKGGTPIHFDPLTIQYDRKPVASAKGTATLADGAYDVSGEVEASYGPGLSGIVPAEPLAMLGTGSVKMRLKASAKPPTAVKATGTTTWTQTEPVSAGGKQVRLAAPATLSHDVTYDGGRLDAVLEGEVPALTVDGVAEASATKFKAVAKADKLPEPNHAELTLTATQGRLKLENKAAAVGPPLEGLKVDLRAGIEGGDRFTLHDFQASLGGKLVVFSAQGSGKIKRKDIQLKGKLAADLPKSFPPVAGNAVSGKIDVPWTLTVVRGKEVDLSGEMTLDKFNWAKGPQFARGISGTIPLSEEILLDKKGIRLAYVITQNPFERVDFERIRPLINRAERVRVEEMGFEEKRYGPLIGFFSLRQNLLVAHQLDVDLRGAGLMYGEMYLDLHPQNRRVGFLTRLTALDLPKLLPKKYLPKLPDEDAKLSGRAGLVFNLTPGTLDGRLDITEIGAPQLVLLINAMDPTFENERMNLARKALGFGAPKFVQVAFQKGYADLALDVTLLGTSQHFDVRGLSLSTWVSGATQSVAKQTEEVIQ